MTRFSTCKRLPPAPGEFSSPERARMLHFGNGIRLQVEFGSLDIRHLDRTGDTRYDYTRRASVIHCTEPDAEGNITGLFPDTQSVRIAIADYLVRRDEQR